MKQVLNDELIYRTALTKLYLSGSRGDVQDMRSLLQLIASVPSGKKLLQRVIMQEHPARLSFVSGFPEQENGIRPRGRFVPEYCSVEVVKIDTTIPEMNKETQLHCNVLMASVLAHELTHFVDLSKNQILDRTASNMDERVLCDVLSEMNAYLMGEQVDKELRARHKLPKMMSCKANGKLDVECFPATLSHKDAMVNALSGQNPKINIYMNKRRKTPVRLRRFLLGAPPSDVFRQNVEKYVQEMGVNMAFDEIMVCLGKSVQLLPCAQKQSLGRSK